MPTITNFLGVNVALPWHDKELDESVSKALGEFVREVMSPEPVTISQHATKYLNRLSDALFVMSRYENHQRGVAEPLWDEKA